MILTPVLFAAVLALKSKFIVKLRSDTPQTISKRDSTLDLAWVQDILSKYDGSSSDRAIPSAITFQYNFNNFMGFAVETSDEAIADIEKNPKVEYWAYDNPIIPHAPVPQTQQGPSEAKSWGIDRIDQRELPLNKQFKDLPNKGEGITVYVIDTGVDARHPEFEGRAKVGPSFVNGVFTELDTDNSDYQGHGTHCAGTIASKSYGVAPKANIVSLKIFDENGGGDAGVVAALQYVAQNVTFIFLFSIGCSRKDCRLYEYRN